MASPRPGTVTGGAAVIAALAAHGVRDVFGIPGTHNLELYRYLPEAGIRHVAVRHEQGAGYSADGYARLSGRPGVLLTTSGPGLTNAVTALATAYADSVAVLVVSPGPMRGTVGRDVGWLHEMKDQQAALEAVCGRSIRVESADEIPETVAAVFERFATERPRPVHLEIPVDVLEGPWSRRPVRSRPATVPARPDPGQVESIAAALEASSAPVLVAGGGARGAVEAIRGLADLGLPVLTTVNGKGVLDESHPASLGAGIRLPAAHAVLHDSDCLLVVGSELGDSDLWGGSPGEGDGRTVVRVDVDPAQLHKNLTADIPVLCRGETLLPELLEAVRRRGLAWQVDPDDRRRIDEAARADAGALAEMQLALAGALPPDTVVAGDSSQVTYYGTVHCWPFTPANRLLYPTGYATLGYGLPAAIGAKIADPDRPVIALIGDGAAMFSIQELMTAVEQRLALPVVIVDNGGYREIRDQMLERDIEPQAVDLRRPDFPALAEAMGAIGRVATTAEEIAGLTAKALTESRPTLIHHQIDDA